MAGLAPAIYFTVVFQELEFVLDEGILSDADRNAFDLEDVHVILTLGRWVSTVFMWSGMALVAAYMTPTLVPDVRNA